MNMFHYLQITFLFLLFSNLQPAFSFTGDTAHYYMKHSYDVQKYQLDMNIYASYTSPYPKSFSAKEIITFTLILDMLIILMEQSLKNLIVIIGLCAHPLN